MRFAIYHPWVYLTSGIERSFVEILRRSRHDWVIYTHQFSPDTTYPELRAAPVVELRPRVSVRRSLGPLLAATRAIASTRLPQGGEQALLVSSEGLGDFVMARAAVPAACFCHTPLKILHDPASAARLRASNPLKWAASRLLGPAFTAADRRMWRRYRHVFANSEETRRRIARARLAPAEAVEVLRPGVAVERCDADPDRPPGDLLLVAGRIMWQKNVELAIDALRLLVGSGNAGGLHLVVAGAVDEKSRPYLAMLRQRATGLPVSFEPDPADQRLDALYREALVLLYTPPNEDWGMVPLEAMARATPVIAVDAGGPRESIRHEETGWLVPATAAAFAERIRHVRGLTPQRLRAVRAAARARAEQFGWDPYVARLDQVMERLAREAGSPRR